MRFDRFGDGYIRDWKRISEAVMKRDKNLCHICNKYVPIPLIHHLDCNRNNNEISNLVCMCDSCHRRWHLHFPNWRWLTDEDVVKILDAGQKLLGKGHWYVRNNLGLKRRVEELVELNRGLMHELKLARAGIDRKKKGCSIKEQKEVLKVLGW